MKIVLGSDGSIELTRGEHITRGQDKSRQVFVEWAEGVSPIDTGQFLADNMVVEMCITRPDGEQSGWLTAVKVDGEIKYLYILQAWDTAFSGQASLQVRWYDITQEEENRIIEVSNEAFFIIDNGKIAQPLNLSSENYNDIVLRFITPLSTQAFRKYNVNALPNTVTYEPDGAKTAPALFYNFTHEVVDLDFGKEIKEKRNIRQGVLLVWNIEGCQTEVFFTSTGKIYARKFNETSCGDFEDADKEIIRQLQVAINEKIEEKIKNVSNELQNVSNELQNVSNELENKSNELEKKQIKNTNNIQTIENALISAGTIAKRNGTITNKIQEIGGTELEGLTIVDESYATITKIKGDTVPYNNTLKHAKISGIKVTGKNFFDSDILLNANGWTKTDNGYSGLVSQLGSTFGIDAGGFFGQHLNLQQQIAISFSCTSGIASTAQSTLSIFVKYTDGTTDGVGTDVKHGKTYYLISDETKTIDCIYAICGKDETLIISEFTIVFGNVADYNEPYIESVISLPKTIELGEWDYIENGQIVRQTSDFITITGNEGWTVTNEGTERAVFSCENLIPNGVKYGSEGTYSMRATRYFTGDSTGFSTTNGKVSIKPFKQIGITTLAGWIAHLQSLATNGTPIVICGQIATPTYEPITFDNQYLVWEKGAEIVHGNDNASYGANPTITNEYIILLGGNEQ